jgi:hypothetical protein
MAVVGIAWVVRRFGTVGVIRAATQAHACSTCLTTDPEQINVVGRRDAPQAA